MNLQTVTAFYLDPANGPTQLQSQNSIIAVDLVSAWNGFRAAVNALGWEPYISPPNDPSDPRSAEGYTKGFFRTPEDQALMVSEAGDGAAPVDQSPHQAGRAFDLDLAGMEAAFDTYDYSTLTATAAQYGFSARVAGEPWHFDDDPASNPNFGSVLAAVEWVDNTQAQEDALVAAGQPTAQQAAVNGQMNNSILLIMAALAAVYGLHWIVEHKRRRQPATTEKSEGGPVYAV